MTLRDRKLADLREERTNLSIEYTNALSDHAPHVYLTHIRAAYDRVAAELMQQVSA